VSSPAVIPSLARVVRGLSALFWGLPLVLLLDAKSALEDSLRGFGFAPVVAASVLVAYGVHQLSGFQPQERVWVGAVERARLLALLLVALAPFSVWWGRQPEERFFAQSMVVLVFAGLAFLLALNHVLVRLAAMLPDETLRVETRFFTHLNQTLLVTQTVLAATYLLLARAKNLPASLATVLGLLDLARTWLVVVLTLPPVALTMTLLWKTKEVIMTSVFRP
jgi:hypothetical protein